MTIPDTTEIISLLVQLLMLAVVSPINRRISKIEEKLDSLRERKDCDAMMCKHDKELAGIGETILDHEKRISRLEGIGHSD